MKWEHNILMTLPQRLILVCVCVSVCVSVKTIPCLCESQHHQSLSVPRYAAQIVWAVFFIFFEKSLIRRGMLFLPAAVSLPLAGGAALSPEEFVKAD